MKTNGERIAALDAFCKRHPTARGVAHSVVDEYNAHGPFGTRQPKRDPIALLILCATWLVIGGLVAWGTWQHFSDPDPFATKVVAECKAGGGTPHVDRAGDGAVLAVRCDH
jgi:hypothetical protein